MNCIIFVINIDFLLSHRRRFVNALGKRGYTVDVVGLKHQRESLDNHGFGETVKFQILPSWDPSEKVSIWKIFSLLGLLRNYYRSRLGQRLVVIGVVPSILVNFSCVGLGCKPVCIISGLGSLYLMSAIRHLRVKRFLQHIFLEVTAFALSRVTRSKIVFQNSSDLELVTSRFFWSPKVESKIIRGVGIDVHGLPDLTTSERSDTGTKTILVVARLIYDKGIMQFAKAIKLLKETSDVKFECVIVGGNTPENPGNLRQAEIDRLSSQYGIRFLGHQDDLSRYYKQSDIFCLPSFREGLPLACLEAATHALPIATSNVAGCRDTVIHKETGLLFNPHDHTDIFKKLSWMLLNSEAAKEMGRKGRTFVVENFNQDLINENLLNFMES